MVNMVVMMINYHNGALPLSSWWLSSLSTFWLKSSSSSYDDKDDHLDGHIHTWDDQNNFLLFDQNHYPLCISDDDKDDHLDGHIQIIRASVHSKVVHIVIEDCCHLKMIMMLVIILFMVIMMIVHRPQYQRQQQQHQQNPTCSSCIVVHRPRGSRTTTSSPELENVTDMTDISV